MTPVVELAGLPGAGKSTLASGLRDRGADQARPWTVADTGVSAQSHLVLRTFRRAAYAGRSAARHPVFALRAARLLLGSGQTRPTDSTRILLQWLATAHLLERAHRGPGVQLLEEGALQAIWTAALRSRGLRPQALWSCLPARARSDVVVLVDVSPEVAADRLAGRSSRHSRTQLLASPERLAELRHGGALLDSVVDHCPVRVVRIDAEGRSARWLVQEVHRTVGAG